MSTLRILAAEWGNSSDWVVETDVGGRYSCSVKGDIGSMGVAGQVDDSMMGRVLVREDGDEIEVVDIVEVIDGMEGVGIKSG